MIKIEIEEKTLLGLLVGSVEERMKFFSDENIIASLDMPTIKSVYQATIDKGYDCDEERESIILLLQGLAYNSNKSKYKEEISVFVCDKLFEIIAEGVIW